MSNIYSVHSAGDSTQPSTSQFSIPTCGSNRDQGDVFVAQNLNVDCDFIFIDSSDEYTSDDEYPDETSSAVLTAHWLAKQTATNYSENSAAVHHGSRSQSMASTCPPQQPDTAASIYPGTSIYIAPPQPADISSRSNNSCYPGFSSSSDPAHSYSSYLGPSNSSYPGFSSYSYPELSSYNGPSMPLHPPPHPGYMHPDPSFMMNPGSFILKDYHIPGLPIYPPQPPGVNSHICLPQQACASSNSYYPSSSLTLCPPLEASTTNCPWTSTTTCLPLVSRPVIINDVEMISHPASPRITDLFDEVEDMEVDYYFPSSSSTQTAATLLPSASTAAALMALHQGSLASHIFPNPSCNVQGGIQNHSVAKARKRSWEATVKHYGQAEVELIPKKRRRMDEVVRPRVLRRGR